MLDDAIAILEWVTHEGTGEQRSYDVWEALRTIQAAGGDQAAIVEFWEACAAPNDPTRRHGVYGNRTRAMNSICRSLGIRRTYRMVEA